MTYAAIGPGDDDMHKNAPSGLGRIRRGQFDLRPGTKGRGATGTPSSISLRASPAWMRRASAAKFMPTYSDCDSMRFFNSARACSAGWLGVLRAPCSGQSCGARLTATRGAMSALSTLVDPQTAQETIPDALSLSKAAALWNQLSNR